MEKERTRPSHALFFPPPSLTPFIYIHAHSAAHFLSPPPLPPALKQLSIANWPTVRPKNSVGADTKICVFSLRGWGRAKFSLKTLELFYCDTDLRPKCSSDFNNLSKMLFLQTDRVLSSKTAKTDIFGKAGRKILTRVGNTITLSCSASCLTLRFTGGPPTLPPALQIVAQIASPL
jgi:hypothetical protein